MLNIYQLSNDFYKFELNWLTDTEVIQEINLVDVQILHTATKYAT